MSNAILGLVDLAKTHGLVAEEGDWVESRVYWFDAAMPVDVRNAGNADLSLRYYDHYGSPQSPPDEGFIDVAAKTAIAFSLKFKEV